MNCTLIIFGLIFLGVTGIIFVTGWIMAFNDSRAQKRCAKDNPAAAAFTESDS